MQTPGIPIFIKRCLCYGVEIYPYELNGILSASNKYSIPDEKLASLKPDDFKKYVKGLRLSICEDSNDWSRGHDLLKELGFEEITRQDGNRSFVTLKYKEL